MDQQLAPKQYLSRIKNIHISFLEFLNKEDYQANDFQDFLKIFNESKIRLEKNGLKLFIHLLTQISNYHHQNSYFFKKITDIINNIKPEIKKFYSDYEIYQLFKSNKHIILYLYEEKFIFPQKISGDGIVDLFFYPELKQYLGEKYIKNIENDHLKLKSENFNQLRKNGVNELEICEIIRRDSIDEFIIYINQNNTDLRLKIATSLFETNAFLNSYISLGNIRTLREPTLIEYAALYGSIKIVKYLHTNGVEYESSIWPYVIHSGNPELLYLLEENKVQPENDSYIQYFYDSIKCHNNEFKEYIENNFLSNDQINKNEILKQCIANYNFILLPDEINDKGNLFNEINNEDLIFPLCKYDYFDFVNHVINTTNIDINRKIQQIQF